MPLLRDLHGNLVLQPHQRPNSKGLEATDAKLIAELKTNYLSALNRSSSETKGTKERLVITTPNADWLPEVNLGHQVVTMCVDGRWGTQDFGQWPQWFFDGQDYFAYILRKPPPGELKTHPLRRLWWDMTTKNFVFEGTSDIGLLIPSIAKEIYDIRVQLMEEVVTCRCEHGSDYNKLHQAAWLMRSCTATLLHTPQSFLDVQLILAAAQRGCLETRALLDKINIWDKMIVPRTIPPANTTILGCVTDRIPLAFEMYEKGVPVWLVRPPSQISAQTTIVTHIPTTSPTKFGICTKIWPGAPAFYQGPLTRDIHESIQKWKPGSMNMLLLENVVPIVEDASTDAANIKNPNKPYSKKSSSSSQRISINRDRFKEEHSPYSSAPLTDWIVALQDVDTNVNKIIQHSNFHLFHGYAFPPPRMFCRNNQTLSAALMAAWLVIRNSWISLISDPKRTLPLPTPQQWRNYLYNLASKLELTQPDEGSSEKTSLAPSEADPESSKMAEPVRSKNNHSSRRAKKQYQESADIFTINVPPKDALQPIEWNNHIVWQNRTANFTAHDQKLLSWDSQEHNFRLELWTLDRCLLESLWKTSEGRAARETKHRALWPNDVMFSVNLPQSTEGIGSHNWRERRPFFQAFHSILVDWPGDSSKELAGIGLTGWDRDTLEKGEKIATRFYCQTFFNYFGRAPCVPHSIPAT